MKALKQKIDDELRKLEHRASLSENPIRRDVLDEVYRLSKTRFYLEKAEKVMPAATVASSAEKSAV